MVTVSMCRLLGAEVWRHRRHDAKGCAGCRETGEEGHEVLRQALTIAPLRVACRLDNRGVVHHQP